MKRVKEIAESEERERLYARGKEQEYFKKTFREIPWENQETEIEDKLIEYDKQQAIAHDLNVFKQLNDRANNLEAVYRQNPSTDPDALVSLAHVSRTQFAGHKETPIYHYDKQENKNEAIQEAA